MRKRIVSCLCAVMMAIMYCVSSLPVSAEYTADELYELRVDWHSLLSTYGLSEDTATTNCMVVTAHRKPNDARIICLYSDGVVYTSTYLFSDGNYYYSTGVPSRVTFFGTYLQFRYNGSYYYSDSLALDGQDVMELFASSEANVSQIESNLRTYAPDAEPPLLCTHTETTLGGVWNQVEATVSPEEDTTESDGGFQLPEDWISGGETLPEGEIDTYAGINEDEAFQQFETLISDESVINDTSFLDSVGLFWAIVMDFIDKLGAWSVVMLLMILGLIAWVLGR